MKITPELIKNAMRRWTTGVCILCAKFDGHHAGMTVNSFTSVSIDPALIVVTLQNESYTKNLVDKSGIFSISILASNQQSIAEVFSIKMGENKDRFLGIKTIELPGGLKAIENALDILECKVIETVDFRHSKMYIAEVTEIINGPLNKPLVYHNRGYHSL